MLTKYSVGTYQGDKPTHNHQGAPSQLSQLAEPLWTDPGLNSGIGVHELISTLRKKKKVQVGIESWNLPTKSSQAKKKAIVTITITINKPSHFFLYPMISLYVDLFC